MLALMRMTNQLSITNTLLCVSHLNWSFLQWAPSVATYNESSHSEAIRQQCETYQQYPNSLERSCQENPPDPAKVVFRPNDTTPATR